MRTLTLFILAMGSALLMNIVYDIVKGPVPKCPEPKKPWTYDERKIRHDA